MNGMKVYKGTDKDIKCRGYQFTPGVEAVEERAELCEAGFHACEAPLDVLAYYPPSEGSRYFEAELEDVSDERHGTDSKVCGKRITIGAELGIPGLVKAHMEYVKNIIEKDDNAKKSSGDDASIGSSGRYARIGSSGDDAKVECKADNAVVSCVGANAKIKAPGGTWITLAEYGEWDGTGYPCVCVKSAQIDGETLKPDTWYMLKGGEFVEVTDDD